MATTETVTAEQSKTLRAGHCDHCDADLTAEQNALAVDTEQGERVCAACQSLHAADAE